MLNKIAATSALVVMVASGAAFADMAELDTDGDGMISYDEMIAAVPDVTEDTFATLDTNADGSVDSEEYAAAEQAGTLPTAN